MSEKVIEIVDIDPQLLYGSGNRVMNHLIRKFPNCKIVARGKKIKISGEDDNVQDLYGKVLDLMEYIRRYGHASEDTIDQLFDSPLMPDLPSDEHLKDVIVYGNNGLVVRARTANQRHLVDLYDDHDMIFTIGPAGSGKTYTAIALAVRALKNREVRRIILTRPAVEAGEKLGFLPGDMKDKLDPYLRPLYDALNDMIPPHKLAQFMEEGIVQIAPLAYMRGRTLDNAFVILDEAQNTTREQLKMFLTRMGRSAKFIINGDITQIDLPRKNDSGLMSTVKLLEKIKGVGIVMFDNSDIVRHPLVGKIVAAFEKESKSNQSE
ncbi:MAG: PhoH family protein [Rikenellaceae bacterium]|nr:PhoH family protein [Rikenellaceae bacterium]